MRSIYKFLSFLLLIISALYWQLPDKKLHVYFFDVGQGDAAFIRSPLNQNIIVDAGPDTSLLDKIAKVMPSFENRIDLIVLTHPHQDHLYGFLDLLDRYEVNAVLMTGVSYENRNYQYFLNLIHEKDVKIYLADDEQDFNFGEGLYLDILYPHSPSLVREIENVNNDSVVFKLMYGENKILFTGDAEKEAEFEMLGKTYDYSADVLKLGHHGSRTSTNSSFLREVNPEYAIVSAGRDNKFKHPHPETLAKLSDKKIYQTNVNGDIEFVMDKKDILEIKTN